MRTSLWSIIRCTSCSDGDLRVGGDRRKSRIVTWNSFGSSIGKGVKRKKQIGKKGKVLCIEKHLIMTEIPTVPKTAIETKEQLAWIRKKMGLCKQRSTIHDHARQRFHALDVSSLATVVTLSTVSSALALFGDTCVDDSIKIATGVMNLTITGLTSWYGFHKYGERKRKHERTRDAYKELARKIETELVLHESDEQHFRSHGALIHQTRNRIDRIEAEAPNLPSSLQKKSDQFEDASIQLVVQEDAMTDKSSPPKDSVRQKNEN